MAELKAQTTAPTSAAELQQWDLLEKLASLEQQFQTLTNPNPALRQRALAAINKAKKYRQRDALTIRNQQQKTWNQVITEYLKQAHLGLASAHHQLSVQGPSQ